MTLHWEQSNGMYAMGVVDGKHIVSIVKHGEQDWRFDGHSYSTKAKAAEAARVWSMTYLNEQSIKPLGDTRRQ